MFYLKTLSEETPRHITMLYSGVPKDIITHSQWKAYMVLVRRGGGGCQQNP